MLPCVSAAWSYLVPVLSTLGQHEVGTFITLPKSKPIMTPKLNKEVNQALSALHHGGILFYDTNKNQVSLWSTLARDAVRQASL